MKIPAIASLLVVSLFLFGCTTNKHVYSADGKCLTCWNNPITGEPINHDGDTSSQTAQQNKTESTESKSTRTTVKKINTSRPIEYKIAFTVPVNVDIAFLKIKKEFGYFTDQEVRQEWGTMAEAKMQTFAYAYDATPSVYYHMRADRGHDGVQAIIDSHIAKQSDQASEVTITYWLTDKSINANRFGESLKRRTRKALSL